MASLGSRDLPLSVLCGAQDKLVRAYMTSSDVRVSVKMLSQVLSELLRRRKEEDELMAEVEFILADLSSDGDDAPLGLSSSSQHKVDRKLLAKDFSSIDLTDSTVWDEVDSSMSTKRLASGPVDVPEAPSPRRKATAKYKQAVDYWSMAPLIVMLCLTLALVMAMITSV